jgi:hypothetical protein
MKKFLVSAAAVAAIATTAMAYDLQQKDSYGNKVINYYNYTANNGVLGGKMAVNENGMGNALIFPVYDADANSGFTSTVRVINTKPYAVVAKVVLYSAYNSREVRDFNIYLSANDEWTGTISEENGKIVIKSTDSASVFNCGTQASAKNPFVATFSGFDGNSKTEFAGRMGYIQVIAMAVPGTKTYHGKHAQLMKDYLKAAANARNITLLSGNICKIQNSVIGGMFKHAYSGGTEQNVTMPYLDLSKTMAGWNAPASDTLIGDIRITNSKNKTDMVMPAIAVNYNNDTTFGLVYYMGETANIADVELSNTHKYDTKNLYTDLLQITNTSKAYVTYGDSIDARNNSVYMTIPFKRELVQSAGFVKNQGIDTMVSPLNSDRTLFMEANSTLAAWSNGTYELGLDIYDNNENKYTPPTGSLTLSPADYSIDVMTQPVPYEVTQLSDVTKYVTDSGYAKGYVVLSGLDNKIYANTGLNYVKNIPGFVTQFLATKPSNDSAQVVTTWIRNQRAIAVDPTK